MKSISHSNFWDNPRLNRILAFSILTLGFFEFFFILANSGTLTSYTTVPYVVGDHTSSTVVTTVEGFFTPANVFLSVVVFLSIVLLSVLLVYSYQRKNRFHQTSINGVSNVQPVSKIRIIKRRELEIFSVLENLSLKTTSILIDDLLPLLKFNNRKDFFKWFSEYPLEIALELHNNSIEFKDNESVLHLKICSICKGSISFQEKVGLCQNCHYLFHHNHITQWLKDHPSCPVCLNRVSKK